MSSPINTSHYGKVRVLRTSLVMDLLPTLNKDGTYAPGPRLTDKNWLPSGSVAEHHEWDEGCWPYYVTDNDNGPTHSPYRMARITRPLTMSEATAVGIYAFGLWHPEVGDGESVVACGCATVVISKKGWTDPSRKPPLVHASGSARVHVAIRAQVIASGSAQVFVCGSAEDPVEVDARGSALVFVQGTHVTVRASERATIQYAVREPDPVNKADPAPQGGESGGSAQDEPRTTGAAIARRVHQMGWSHPAIKPVRDAVAEGVVGEPTAHELCQRDVADGWRVVTRPEILEDESCPSLSKLAQLRAPGLLRALDELTTVEGHTHLHALVPWMTNLVVSGRYDTRLNQTAIRALCKAAGAGSVEARQVLLSLVVPTLRDDVLAVLLESTPLWPEMVEAALALELPAYYQAAVKGWTRVLCAAPADRAAEALHRAIEKYGHREGMSEALLRALLDHGEENLVARPALREAVLYVLSAVRDEPIILRTVRHLLRGKPMPDERERILEIMGQMQSPAGVADLVRMVRMGSETAPKDV